MGIAPDIAKSYLDDEVYTPRQDLILVDSLHRLGAATGREPYLSAAMAAVDEVEANFFVNTAQILRGYHEKQGPITGITMVGPLTLAQTKSGAAVIPFALDHGVWTANADKVSQELKTTYRAPGFNGTFELWVTGTLSARGKQELQARGFHGGRAGRQPLRHRRLSSSGGAAQAPPIAFLIAASNDFASKGFGRYATPPCCARSRVGASSLAVMKMIGIEIWVAVSRSWSSNPLNPGMWTSSTRHWMVLGCSRLRNSSADSKVFTAKPAPPSRRLKARRTEASSSTMPMTVDTRLYVPASAGTCIKSGCLGFI